MTSDFSQFRILKTECFTIAHLFRTLLSSTYYLQGGLIRIDFPQRWRKLRVGVDVRSLDVVEPIVEVRKSMDQSESASATTKHMEILFHQQKLAEIPAPSPYAQLDGETILTIRRR
jgi:hypothetical protein